MSGAPLEIGGRYQVVAQIGKGAMGVVYKAYDPVLDRTVAVKKMAADIVGSEEHLDRFYVEARAAARLNHPHIVTIHELEEFEGDVYMVMELLEGASLGAVLDRGAELPLAARLSLITQVCEGLDYAHDRGIVHRDIKPANLHLSATGVVKILDFGIARLAAGGLTQSGALVGTPNYMAPEQITGGEIDRRTDLFALGAVLYEMCAGSRPFSGDSLPALLYKIAHQEHRPLDEAAPGTPPALSNLCDRLLSKNREDRPASGAEVIDALTIVGPIDHNDAIAAAVAKVVGAAGSETMYQAAERTPTPRPAGATPAPRPRSGRIPSNPRGSGIRRAPSLSDSQNRAASGVGPVASGSGSAIRAGSGSAIRPGSGSQIREPLPATPTPEAAAAAEAMTALHSAARIASPSVADPTPRGFLDPRAAGAAAAPAPPSTPAPFVEPTPAVVVPVTRPGLGLPVMAAAGLVVVIALAGGVVWYWPRGGTIVPDPTATTVTAAPTGDAIPAGNPSSTPAPSAPASQTAPPIVTPTPTESPAIDVRSTVDPIGTPPTPIASTSVAADTVVPSPAPARVSPTPAASHTPAPVGTVAVNRPPSDPPTPTPSPRSVAPASPTPRAVGEPPRPPSPTPMPSVAAPMRVEPPPPRNSEPPPREALDPGTVATFNRRESGPSPLYSASPSIVAAVTRIRWTLDEYGRAIEARDLDALRAVREPLGGIEQQWLSSSHPAVVRFTDVDVKVNGTSAVVTCRRTIGGGAGPSNDRVEIRLTRKPAGWVIQEIH